VESAAMGLLAGRLAAAERLGRPAVPPPPTTALGALLAHVTGGHLDAGRGSFQPMNINYGLLPPMDAPRRDAEGRRLGAKERGRAKKRLMGERALADLESWAGDTRTPIAAE
jgi:methylenetetrahydrofolate--tRNA-(uracil-5-)-methyltransferase